LAIVDLLRKGTRTRGADRYATVCACPSATASSSRRSRSCRSRPLRRAARWDGLFPIDLPGPEALEELLADLRELRGGELGEGYEVVVTNPAGTDPEPWAEAGATWCLTGFGPQPTAAEVRAAIDTHA
jgi:hypothetical protein